MDAAHCWVSHPQEWQPLFRRWHDAHPGRTRLHVFPQFGGSEVVGLTVGGARRPVDALPPFRLLVTVPHAHEPAPTAAAVDVACQLVAGTHLDGSPSALPTAAILACSLITLLPDTNSQGRARSSPPCWDGTFCDNETFLRTAFGIAADGQRFGRYPQWRPSEHHPRQIGLVYECLEDDLYVEPNTSRLSTHSRVIDALFGEYRYTHMLDMHQHEFSEQAQLPADFEDLPVADREGLLHWAEVLVLAWRRAGAQPRPDAAMPYPGQPRQGLLAAFWRDRCPGMLRMLSEDRNNRLEPAGIAPTPLPYQFATALAALEATLSLAEGAGPHG